MVSLTAVLATFGVAGAAAAAPQGTLLSELGAGAGFVAEEQASPDATTYALAVQSNGSIVTGEADAAQPYAQLTRRTPDGALDTSFGGTGIVTVDLGPALPAAVQSIAFDSQDRIIAAGSIDRGGATGRNAFVIRLTPAGALDPTFGVGGVAETEACGNMDDAALAVTVLADDSIVVGGYAASACVGPSEVLVYKLTPAGALDASFGTAGIVDAFAIVDIDSRVVSIRVQPDGRLVVAGNSSTATDAFAARLETDGSYDTSFGGLGLGIAPLPNIETVADVDLRPDGTMLVAGVGSAGSGGNSVRLLDDGTLDTAYGAGGVAETPFDGVHMITSSGPFGALGSTVLSDGSMLLCGAINDSGTTTAGDPGVVRFTPEGNFDTSFGVGGYASVHLATWDAAPEFVGDCTTDDATGRIMLAGGTANGTSGSYHTIPYLLGFAVQTDFILPVATADVTVGDGDITFAVHASDVGSGLADEDGAYSFDGGATWQVASTLRIDDVLPGSSRSATVVVRDRADNRSTAIPLSGTVAPDTTVPAATVTTSSDYRSIRFDVTASDARPGLDAAAYSYDGGSTWVTTSSLVRTGLTPKTRYDQDVLVRDLVGNQTHLVASASTLEDGLPVVRKDATARLPRGLTTRTGKVFRVDNKSGAIRTLTASFNGTTVNLVDGLLDLRRLPEGHGLLTVRAVDEDGDVGLLRLAVRIDRTAPTVASLNGSYALGPVLTLQAKDNVSGVARRTVRVRLPNRLGKVSVVARVADRDGNKAVRRLTVTRRLALADQRLNFGLVVTTFAGAHVASSVETIRASFRFTGMQPPWYAKSDLQTPYVVEAQWRLERVGCLTPGTYRAGSLDLPTIRGVQRYQRANHLPVLGTIGPRTRAALDHDLVAGLPRSCR
ncbi:MAG: cya [Thermoleophilia bacterium]|nr:cya [Thermoleophilia bacterium]